MATLHKNREVSFLQLRDALKLTEGNLGSHIQKLRDAGYLESREALTTRGFEIRYHLTQRGADALLAYIADLQRLLPLPREGEPAPEPPVGDRFRESGV